MMANALIFNVRGVDSGMLPGDAENLAAGDWDPGGAGTNTDYFPGIYTTDFTPAGALGFFLGYWPDGSGGQYTALKVNVGFLGNWDIITPYLYSLASGTPSSSPADGVVLSAVTGQARISVYEDIVERVRMGYLSASVYGIKVWDGVDNNDGNVIFEASDSQQKFAGWSFTNTAQYNLVSGTPSSSPSDGVVLDATAGQARIAIYEDTAERVRIGYLSAGIYGIKVVDTESNVIFEASDTQQKIAAYNFDQTYLYSLASGTPGSSPSDGIVIEGGSTARIRIYENTEKRLEMGYLAAGKYGIKGYANDGTTMVFEISDDNISLAGWAFTNTVLQKLTANIGIVLDSAVPIIKIGDLGGTYIEIDGANERIQSSNFVSGATGSRWETSTGDAEFNNVVARGNLIADTLLIQENAVTRGTQLIVTSGAELFEPAETTGSGTFTLKVVLPPSGGNPLGATSICVLDNGTNEVWFTPGAGTLTDGTHYLYTATWLNGGAHTFPIGTAIADYGASGAGGLLLTADRDDAPYMDIFTHAGDPWSTLSTHVRLGNLDGITDTDFGIAPAGFGLYTDNVYLKGSIVTSTGSGQRITLNEYEDGAFNNALVFYDSSGEVVRIDDSIFGSTPGIKIKDGGVINIEKDSNAYFRVFYNSLTLATDNTTTIERMTVFSHRYEGTVNSRSLYGAHSGGRTGAGSYNRVGVYALTTLTGATNPDIPIALYASADSANSAVAVWAGYFDDGDVYIKENLVIDGNVDGVDIAGHISSHPAPTVLDDILVGTGLDVANGADTIVGGDVTINLDLTEVIATDGANRVLTSDGDGTLTAEANLGFDGSVLGVTGNINISGDYLLANGNYIGISGAERLEFYTAGYAAFMGCNVGIGTSPGGQLHIKEITTNHVYAILERSSNTKQAFWETRPAGTISGSNVKWLMGMSQNTNTFTISYYDGTISSYPFNINNTGNVGIGTDTLDAIRLGQKLEVANSADWGGAVLSTWSANNTHSVLLELNKSGSNTIGTHIAVADDETLGVISFRGSDGVEFLTAASIRGEVDGAITGGGVNDMPGRLVFGTTPDGGSTPTERMRIDSAGNVGIGTDEPAHILDISSTLADDTYLSMRIGGSDNNYNGGQIIFRGSGAEITSIIGHWDQDINGAGADGSKLEFQAWNGSALETGMTLTKNGVGINEAAPDEKLEVNGNVHITGDSYWTGDGSGVPYGFVEGDHINWTQASAAQNTWYNISDANMVSRYLNTTFHDGSGKITVGKAGIYRVSFNVDYEVTAANVHIEFGIEVDGSGSADAIGPHVHTTSKFANQEQDSGSAGLMDLAANATIEVAMRTIDTGNPNFIVDNVHLTCVMVGGT